MIKINRREKILIYAGAGLIAIFLINKLFLSVIRSSMNTMKSRITSEEAKLKMGIEFQKRKDAMLAEYKGYEAYLKEEKMPEADIFAKFLKEVEGIARESRVSILTLNPQNKVEEADSYRKFTAELKVEASMEELYDFLYRVQNSKLLLKIDRMSVTSKDELGSVLRLDVSISIAIL